MWGRLVATQILSGKAVVCEARSTPRPRNYFTSGMLDSTFLIAERSLVGSRPMAMGSPSHSLIRTWGSSALAKTSWSSSRCV
jgi:hypothetical protein